jgi:hypothetical protein
MPISVADALNQGRTKLGVKASDPEFSPEVLLAALNAAVSELHQDLSGIDADQLIGEATLTSSDPEGHRYVFATQTPSVGAVARAIAVRLDDANGVELDRLPTAQLDAYGGATYALLGADGEQSIRTSRGVAAARPLFLRYVAAPATLDEGGVVPLYVPAHFVDLLGLLIAEQCFSQGGEQAMPNDQAALAVRRRAALWDYWAMRSPQPLRRADTSEGIAPYLF